VTSPFDAAVAIETRGAGRYGGVVDDGFDGPAAPNGGVLAAMMLRAAQAELGPGAPSPRSIAAHYLEAPAHGPVEIEVEVLRRGKRVAVADVRMLQEGTLACQATVVASAGRVQEAGPRGRPPAAPPADSVEPYDMSAVRGAPRIFSRVELRPTFGPALFSRGEQALTGGWMSLRGDDAPLDAARLCALTDLWWPAVFGTTDAPVYVPTLQLTVYLRATESERSAPVLGRFESRHAAEGHVEESAELWSADGELLAESTQLALLLRLPAPGGSDPSRGPGFPAAPGEPGGRTPTGA
jgi:acyl-CoA thioesterase